MMMNKLLTMIFGKDAQPKIFKNNYLMKLQNTTNKTSKKYK